MNRKRIRPLIFVCAAILNGELLTKSIIANNNSEAIELFTEQFGVAPKEILGPFLKKRVKVVESTKILKFSNQTKKAIYNDWIVNAFILIEPPDQAYLVFIRRTDNKKATLPAGTITVPISELRFI
jgi:hypothetical protein